MFKCVENQLEMLCNIAMHHFTDVETHERQRQCLLESSLPVYSIEYMMKKNSKM